jgi:AcrR family transcriptional regulator
LLSVSTLSDKRHTRSAYHHGDLKNALIEAAVAAARSEGPQAVQVRELARQLGVSHNAAYRHFESREGLLAAVAWRGLEELGFAMEAALAELAAPRRRPRSSDEPARQARQRLRAIGKAYVRYAIAEPGLFKTIWAGVDFPPAPPNPEEPPGRNPYWILSRALDEMVAAGALSPRARPLGELVAWSAVHGLSMLVIEGPLRALPPAQQEQALERLCDVVEAGL